MTEPSTASIAATELLLAMRDHRAALDRLEGELLARLSDQAHPIEFAEVLAGVTRLLQSSSRVSERFDL